jgi:hypothetical protein
LEVFMMRSPSLVKGFLGALITVGMILILSVVGNAGQVRMLNGELVRLENGSQRFRLVGNDGTFTAPASIDLTPFEGMPVEVEIDGDGRVQRITEMSMQIEPVTHRIVELSGSLVPGDPVAGTFKLDGDPRQFTAPQGVDVRAYANQLVRVRLDENGRVNKLTLATPPAGHADVVTAKDCIYAGAGYSSGAPLCQSGTQYVCENGEWRSLGTACAPAAPQGTP